jgi:hypothetical protein
VFRRRWFFNGRPAGEPGRPTPPGSTAMAR